VAKVVVKVVAVYCGGAAGGAIAEICCCINPPPPAAAGGDGGASMASQEATAEATGSYSAGLAYTSSSDRVCINFIFIFNAVFEAVVLASVAEPGWVSI
jgi:hypothetical protein